jgi:hypothetical protein
MPNLVPPRKYVGLSSNRARVEYARPKTGSESDTREHESIPKPSLIARA